VDGSWVHVDVRRIKDASGGQMNSGDIPKIDARQDNKMVRSYWDFYEAFYPDDFVIQPMRMSLAKRELGRRLITDKLEKERVRKVFSELAPCFPAPQDSSTLVSGEAAEATSSGVKVIPGINRELLMEDGLGMTVGPFWNLNSNHRCIGTGCLWRGHTDASARARFKCTEHERSGKLQLVGGREQLGAGSAGNSGDAGFQPALSVESAGGNNNLDDGGMGEDDDIEGGRDEFGEDDLAYDASTNAN
jgi:hypothetical protein